MRAFIFAVLILNMLTSTITEAAMRQVTFESQGSVLAGNLYLPEGNHNGEKFPGVVVTGAWTTVKEQMPAVYAQALAERGFAALTFDFRGWGQSPDKVMYLEDPKRKIEDIQAAAKFLAGVPEVDATRVAGLGICASAGYMSDAAAGNPDLKAVALAAPWLHDAEIVDAVYGGRESVENLIKAGREAAAAEKPVLMEAASAENEHALMYQAPYYTESERGLIPEYDNKFNVASWEGWLTYDALITAETQDTPILMVHSEAAAIPQGAKEYARRMGDNARFIWLENVSQFDFYDRPDAVKAAVDAAARHFNSNMK